MIDKHPNKKVNKVLIESIKCQPSVNITNQRELPQNFSPCNLSQFFHLFLEEIGLYQKLSLKLYFINSFD